MKSIFIISMLLGSFVFATTPEHMIATLSPVDIKIKSVSLSQSGVLYIQKANGDYKQVRLTSENMQDLSSSASLLSQAEITTDERLVVCMMILPAFSRHTLSIWDTETPGMKVVLTTDSCAVPSFTHPKEDYYLLQAKVLKAQLMTLARQFAQD